MSSRPTPGATYWLLWTQFLELLILDPSMPVMNGLDAVRKIMSISPGTGIVLFTAHASEQLLTEAKNIGIRAVIPKDGKTSMDDLVAALREIPRAAWDRAIHAR